MALEEIRGERLKKLNTLREHDLDPYPAALGRVSPIREVTRRFSALARAKKFLRVAGRIMARREHGGSTFFDIRDASGKLQAYFRKDVTLNYDLALEMLDIGDFLAIEGRPFTTKKGEPTLEVTRWEMLAKSLRPLPEKWHGLRDVEERFRKRYLDLLMNEEVRTRFLARSEIIRSVREFHEKNGFLEVETPMLHPIPGGTLAKPFTTHHNALDADLYLRIAPELYLKRLLVGGLERVFEIGKSFRNEGIDIEHNPEFTMVECYAAYWDEEEMMRFVERLFAALAKKFGSKQSVTFEGRKISFTSPFPRTPFKELLARYALITDYERETQESFLTRAKQFGIEVKPRASKGGIADEIFKKICRPYLQSPTFVVNHPVEISPLAKKRKEDSTEARRFQLVVAGLELANGWAELNDPLEQRERFEEQEALRKEGEEEAHRTDEDYLEALEYGMPPAAGLGIGIDRLAMLLTGARNIREVVLFPTMRPKKEE